LTSLPARTTGLITLELSPDALPVPPPVFESEPFGASAASQPAAAAAAAAVGAAGDATDGGVAAGLADLSVRQPGHKDFRGQYFSGFKSGDP
jgi:hypothetical protein